MTYVYQEIVELGDAENLIEMGVGGQIEMVEKYDSASLAYVEFIAN